jgi:LPS-assembly protein
VATATANANYALFFQLELGGIASIGSDPMKLLNRTIPGYTNTNVLPESYRQQNYE